VREPEPADEGPVHDAGVAALQEEIAELRDAVFILGDCSRRALGGSAPGLQVALQAAAHQLCEAERALRRAS